jgi:nucleoside-diphosphate-sugar epimerase
MRVLVTGSSGYYGKIFVESLIDNKIDYLAIDILDSPSIPIKNKLICDIAKNNDLRSKLKNLKFDTIVHLASQIDFGAKSQKKLYVNNIQCTKNLIQVGIEHKIRNFIFTSSNSVFLGCKKSLIGQSEKPKPIDMYGRSKYDSEKLLLKHKSFFKVNILRCPNIIDSGRVGMLSILFELLNSNATLWVLGGGRIKHQCVYAKDLNNAILKLLRVNQSYIFNIGSENVPTFKDTFVKLIASTKSRSKIRSIPVLIAVPILKILYKLRLSPMGPYQFRMLTQNFEFDISNIKRELKWKPTKNNFEILEIAYNFYVNNKKKLGKSSNSRSVSMGLLNILKYIKI